jgi:DGQHR domain-containing protein
MKKEETDPPDTAPPDTASAAPADISPASGPAKSRKAFAIQIGPAEPPGGCLRVPCLIAQGDRSQSISFQLSADRLRDLAVSNSLPLRSCDTDGGTNRPIKKAHVDAIAQYFREAPRVVSNALVLSPDAELTVFADQGEPTRGHVSIPEGCKFHIVDGQHRWEAAKQASDAKQAFGEEPFHVVVFQDEDSRSRQSDFAILSRNLPVDRSLRVALGTDGLSAVVKRLIKEVAALEKRVEVVASTPKKTDEHDPVWTANHIAGFVKCAATGNAGVGDDKANEALKKLKDPATTLSEFLNRFFDAIGYSKEGDFEIPDSHTMLKTPSGLRLLGVYLHARGIWSETADINKLAEEIADGDWSKNQSSFPELIVDRGEKEMVVSGSGAISKAKKRLIEQYEQRKKKQEQGVEVAEDATTPDTALDPPDSTGPTEEPGSTESVAPIPEDSPPAEDPAATSEEPR